MDRLHETDIIHELVDLDGLQEELTAEQSERLVLLETELLHRLGALSTAALAETV